MTLSAKEPMDDGHRERTEVDNYPPSQNKWLWIWRGINSLMSVFFLLCAYVQLNDEDLYVWIPVYTIPAVLCATTAFKPELSGNFIWKLISNVHIGCCALGFVYTIILVVEEMSGRWHNPLVHEVGRELAGLGIVMLWLYICRWVSVGNTSAYNSQNMNALILITGILAIFPLFMWSLCFVEIFGSSLGHCHDMFPGMLG